jgi:hypothetical protein
MGCCAGVCAATLRFAIRKILQRSVCCAGMPGCHGTWVLVCYQASGRAGVIRHFRGGNAAEARVAGGRTGVRFTSKPLPRCWLDVITRYLTCTGCTHSANEPPGRSIRRRLGALGVTVRWIERPSPQPLSRRRERGDGAGPAPLRSSERRAAGCEGGA